MALRKPLFVDYSSGSPFTQEMATSDLLSIGGLTLTSLGTGVVKSSSAGVLSSALLLTADIDDGQITSAKIADGTIVNADISASAAVAYSKLALSNSIVNADVSSSAAIAYSKLALTGSLVNADVASNAAIAYSKLNLANSIATADLVDGSVTSAKIADGAIVNADVNASAAIAGTKISPDFGSQNVATTGTLAAGAATLSSATVGSGGGSTVASIDASGNASFSGTLSVTGASTLTGGATMGANLAMGGFKITGLATCTQATDAANKGYVDAVKQGLFPKDAVRAASTGPLTLSGTQTVDGVVLVAGDRVLAKDQSTGSTNGIYVVASGAWSRAEDADTDAEMKAGTFVFVTEGTANADSGWVLATDNPITLGTTALQFVQFSGAGMVIAGAGLTKTANTIDVGAGNGIAVAADSIAIDLATDPALQFTSGKLDAKLNASKGLAKDSNGAYLKLAASKGLSFDGSGDLQAVDGDGIAIGASGIEVDLASNSGLEFSSGKLQIKAVADQTSHTANGLEVLGVPSLFKIAGSATNASVSAANLNTLTAGPSTNGGALHMHVAEVAYLDAASDVSSKCIAINSSGAAAATAPSGDGWVLGVCESYAGGVARVVRSGKAADVLSSATPGAPYYMGADGALSASLPASGRVVLAGFALSASDLMVQIRDFGQRAA